MTAQLGAERSTSTETADGPPPPELRDALRDLDEATAEVREEASLAFRRGVGEPTM